MYILTFMFKPGIKVESLGPQEIVFFILQSQAGSAALKSYPSGVFLTSSNQPVVEIPHVLGTICPETELPPPSRNALPNDASSFLTATEAQYYL